MIWHSNKNKWINENFEHQHLLFQISTCSFGSRGIKFVQLYGICYMLMGVWTNNVTIQRSHTSRKYVRNRSIHSGRRHYTNRRKNNQLKVKISRLMHAVIGRRTWAHTKVYLTIDCMTVLQFDSLNIKMNLYLPEPGWLPAIRTNI
jgi:hypothetical protein